MQEMEICVQEIKQARRKFNILKSNMEKITDVEHDSDLNEIEFVPEISEFGKLDKLSGHLIIDFISIDKVFDISVKNDLNEIMLKADKLRNIH